MAFNEGDLEVLAQCSQKIGVSTVISEATRSDNPPQVSLRNACLKSVVKALGRATTPDIWLRLLGAATDSKLRSQDKYVLYLR